MEITRRRHARIPLSALANIYSSGHARGAARVSDVSLSGLALRGASHLALGERIYLEVSLPRHRDVPVMAIGIVRWLTGQDEALDAGIEVLKFFPAGRTALRAFVNGARRSRFNFSLLDG